MVDEDSDDLRRIRYERLANVYMVLTDQLRNDDERYTDAINIFVLLQTIIFAGYIQLNIVDSGIFSVNRVLYLLKLILPFIGAMLCFNGIYVFRKRVDAMDFWLEQLYRIEKDADLICRQSDRGLDIFTLRQEHREKHRSRLPRSIGRILEYQWYYLGIIFFITWALIILDQALNLF